MKASLKFRDDEKPLLRAKIPLNVLNFPFQSGVVAGETKELCLQLSTFFDSGPSLKLAYKPNDASNPFTFAIKTGTGKYGSPIDGSMVVSTEFNFASHGGNPSFCVHFKPKFGDFGIRKAVASVFGERSEEDNSIEVIEKPKGYMPENFEFLGMNKIRALPSASSVADRLLTGLEMNAATSLPLLSFANVKFQWGLRFPTEMKNVLLNKRDGLVVNRLQHAVSFQTVPFLVMNKISVEEVRDGKGKEKISERDLGIPHGAGKDEVSTLCFGVRHQLEALRDENGMLKKAVEDLRSEVSSGKMIPFAGELKHKEEDKL